MQRVRVPRTGEIEVVYAPDPEPGPGEVVVEIRAAGLNFSDLMQRDGLYLGGPRPPFFPGIEAAGTVVAHGPGTTAPPLGARVIALAAGGLQAARAAVSAAACTPLPDALSFEAGAALAVNYLTAHHALTTVAHARPGEVVLIHAAGGGVGTAAVQLAHALRLRIIATASTEAKRDRVFVLGAHTVTDYDGFVGAARALGGANIVLESIGGDVLARSLGALAPLGRVVLLGLAGREARPIDPVKLLFRSQAVLGLHLSAVLARPELAGALGELVARAASGELAVQVGHVLPLSDIRHAHELLASRDSYGKIVLVP